MYSHPKLQKLEEVVLQHFRLWAESSADKNGEVLLEQWKRYDSFMQHEFKSKADMYNLLSVLKQ